MFTLQSIPKFCVSFLTNPCRFKSTFTNLRGRHPKAGNFNTLFTESDDARTLNEMYRALDKTDSWSRLAKSESPSLDNAIWERIGPHLKYNHSGASYGCSLSRLHYIAQNGWSKYVREFRRFNLEKKD
jgi:hypothetical protein